MLCATDFCICSVRKTNIIVAGSKHLGHQPITAISPNHSQGLIPMVDPTSYLGSPSTLLGHSKIAYHAASPVLGPPPLGGSIRYVPSS